MEPPGRIVACCGTRATAMCGVLREAGFKVVEADGAGAEAMILDGALPSAAELCAASRLPVIEVVHEAPHEGADAYLTPLGDPGLVVATVNAVIRRWRAARSAEQLLGGILEHAPAVIYSCSPEGAYKLVNHAWEAVTGRRREEILGRSLEEVWPGELARTFHEGGRRVLETRAPLTEEQAVDTPAGPRVFHTVKFPVLDASGTVEGIAGISFDITQRKQVEEALRAHEEQLLIALESASMGAWCYTLSTGELDASSQAKAMHGLPPGEPIVCETAIAVVHPEDRARMTAELRRVIGGPDRYKTEYRIVWPNGDVRSIAAQGRLVVDPKTESRRIFGVVQDVTEWRRLEERLLEKRKLESVGRLAGGLAHRLNNALTEVLGNIGFALDTLDKRDPAREPLDIAAHACTGMAGLTRDLLAYAGRALAFMGPVHLSRLVAAQPLAEIVSAPVRLKLELEPDVPLLEGDADQLARLTAHLVANAVEAIPAGAPGAVTLAVMARDLRAGELEGFHGREEFQPGRYVCLQVTDSGCGMDAVTLPLIFDPFFSTKFMGRGLGLASVLGVVRSHRGGIRVESGLGKGTSVTVCFPAKRLPDGQ